MKHSIKSNDTSPQVKKANIRQKTGRYSLKNILMNTVIGLCFIAIGILFIELSRSNFEPSTGMLFVGIIAFMFGLIVMVIPYKLINF